MSLRIAIDWLVTILVAILVVLFAVQSRGTARVAAFFGPVMVLWFVVIGVAGLAHIVARPEILLAFSPSYAVSFLLGHGAVGLFTLGAVFLDQLRGADMGAPLPLFESIMIAWPQTVGLIAATIVLFVAGYILFQRLEVRA